MPPTAPPPSLRPPREAQPPLAIGVLIAGWHSGLVLSARDLRPRSPLLETNPQAKYFSVGWGNRRFYMAPHPSWGDAVAALFRSPSALFLQGASAPADLSEAEPEAQIHWVCADRAALWRVESYIEEYLSRPRGRPVDLGSGPLPGSHFYASTGHYSLAHTCNTWTVAALQFAGLPVRAGGVIFSSQVARRIQSLRACPAP
ncbi:MAG: DUF2459 domain-containing protein [Steroidobacteraceae bacterium]